MEAVKHMAQNATRDEECGEGGVESGTLPSKRLEDGQLAIEELFYMFTAKQLDERCTGTGREMVSGYLTPSERN
jgi:hypothetical protein